jgi:hypothetical protein
MKGGYGDLLTGILVGAVIGGLFSTHLGLLLQIGFGVVVALVALKVLDLIR